MEIHENLELGNLVIDGEEEIWKQVNQIEGLEMFREWYYISSFGRVKSVGGHMGNRIMKQSNDRYGYLFIGLRLLDGKQKKMKIHRLVALAFVGGYGDGLVCNHLDEQKKNNYYNNLEWTTVAKNINHGTRTKRQAEKLVIPVIGECIKTGDVIEFDSMKDAGRNGFHSGAISSACRGKLNPQHKHGGTNVYKGFKWSYKETA